MLHVIVKEALGDSLSLTEMQIAPRNNSLGNMIRHHLVILCSNTPFLQLSLRIHNASCHRNHVVIGGSFPETLIKAHFAHSVAEMLYISIKK